MQSNQEGWQSLNPGDLFATSANRAVRRLLCPDVIGEDQDRNVFGQDCSSAVRPYITYILFMTIICRGTNGVASLLDFRVMLLIDTFRHKYFLEETSKVAIDALQH
jgi:hypothetical protein